MARTKLYPSYLITGASSGIGHALALEFAKRARDANVPLALAITARREQALNELREAIIKIHPTCVVVVKRLDVTSGVETIRACIDECHAAMGPIHCFVVNAGVATLLRDIGGDGDFARDAMVIQTNVLGSMATVDAAVRYIKSNGINKLEPGAHIVGMSSITGSLLFPRGSAYCVSKAALNTYLRILALETRNDNIAVTILKPGWIDTPISQHIAIRPFVITAELGAELMASHIARKTSETFVPGWPWTLFAWFMSWAPEWLVLRVAKIAAVEGENFGSVIGGKQNEKKR
ncbi:hypothetical protein AMAG_16529 [Allomyces macrogynus ATCC 38327]|uniref:Ketoreductase domain-containing protein n=1 Tax=Allomyces macrogynus (strain ATCC 38327) TaxID=578462 RepID=A0A0L0TCU2_ALLM3|nr:hypothetical protein AMAG_16529 [Allomyces macrogynus ATCC 38327]|eukprot:KNE72485.1 hypothetical protein AMAG_16529 [Allomyces macrogynus ATCC 38327]